MTRKEFLKTSCTLGAAAAVSGCSLIFDSELRLGTLAELEAQGYLVREFNWNQILVRRVEEKLTVFSLVCSHKKCTVEWIPREKIFQCPCHDGQYDEAGNVLDGPPPAPLTRFRAEVRGEEIWVLNEKVEV